MRILSSLSAGLLGLVASAALLQAGERPTLVHTNDPRPDILPHPFYQNHTEYRARLQSPSLYRRLDRLQRISYQSGSDVVARKLLRRQL